MDGPLHKSRDSKPRPLMQMTSGGNKSTAPSNNRANCRTPAYRERMKNGPTKIRHWPQWGRNVILPVRPGSAHCSPGNDRKPALLTSRICPRGGRWGGCREDGRAAPAVNEI